MTKPKIGCPASSSNTGAYKISWQGPDGITYRLEENGEILYEGLQKASTVTGRSAGHYTYRVGSLENTERTISEWSEDCHVDVAPPTLGLALSLFSIGFLVFLSVLILVVRGHQAHKQGRLG